MAPGAVSTFHVDVLVDVSAVPSVTNAATVGTTTADLDPTDDVDTDTVEVPLSVLDMSKELAEQLYAGSEALYRLSVRNAGPTATRGTVTVVDQLPADLTYVSSSGDGWACAAEGSTVTCDNDGVIPVGATAVIDVTVRVGAAAGANVANTASVTGGNEVDGVELDETLLPDIIGSIDEGLADVIGVETEGGTVPDGVDDANGNVLARTGMSPVVAILLGLGAVLAGAALVGGTRRRFWWELRWRW